MAIWQFLKSNLLLFDVFFTNIISIWKISNFINIFFLPDYIITHSKMWLISKTKISRQTRPNNFESLHLFWKQQEKNKIRQKVSRKRRNENYSAIRNCFCNQNPSAKVMWNGSTQYQKPTSFRSSFVSLFYLVLVGDNRISFLKSQQCKCSSTRVLVFYSNKVFACFLVSLSFATQRALIQVFVDIDKLEWLCKLKKQTGKNRRSSRWIYNVMYTMHFVSFYWLGNPSIINVFTNLTHNEYWCQIQWYDNAWFDLQSAVSTYIPCPRK